MAPGRLLFVISKHEVEFFSTLLCFKSPPIFFCSSTQEQKEVEKKVGLSTFEV